MEHNTFPTFVPDQLLTSDNLNQMFDYLDEQEHLTRVCLIGIGIVCGLQVETNSAGTSITITKGCGITSQGYLVQFGPKTFTEYLPFDPVKARYYDRFVNDGTKKFDLYELVEAAVEEESVPLTDAFITDKVLLIYVELLEEHAKNCDPNSCDDKGINVTVTFRPLLVSKSDADALKSAAGGTTPSFDAGLLSLPELRMRRVDVPFSGLVDTAAVFEAFLQPISKEFLSNLQQTLTKTYVALHDFVADVFPTNPFGALAGNFQFLADRSMTVDQVLHAQYYYDLFSDLFAAYEELRLLCRKVSGVCCPGDSFPRHLLLGEAKGYSAYVHSNYRHYFIPSPILARDSCVIQQLRVLLVRLGLLATRFHVPQPKRVKGALVNEFVRMTPSVLGPLPLSQKAIPYYYSVTQAPNPLYTFWNADRSGRGASNQNLSYHAVDYNTTDESVRFPLLYDLEAFNFLRIEGHIAQSYTRTLASIEKQRAKYRLPIDAIALSADSLALLQKAASITDRQTDTLTRNSCHFRDLDALYSTLEKALICFLCKEMKYYYGLSMTSQTPGPATLVPKVTLLTKCDPAFRYATDTVGAAFEEWYPQMKKSAYTRAESTLSGSAYTTYKNLFPTSANTTGTTGSILMMKAATTDSAPLSELTSRVVVEAYSAAVNQFMLYILYYIERLSELLKGSLLTLDISEFEDRFNDLQRIATAYKQALSNRVEGAISFKVEDILDHLDRIVYCCDLTQFKSIVAEFERRWRLLEALRRLAYYEKKCPGLQHKAGVPMGGTFILIYHEKSAIDDSKLRKFVGAEKLIETEDAALMEIREAIELRPKESSIDDLIEEIPDGTVIADFYLPFICCSDCPPIQYHITTKETNEGAGVTILVNPGEFCNDQQDPVPIAVSPPGGTVTGEGVEKSETSGFVFNPSKVNVGQSVSKEVKLTYTVEGASATVKVRVFHTPKADFTITSKPTIGSGHIEVDAGNSTFVGQYSWNFGDESDAVLTEEAEHDYQKSGDYPITLTVTNGKCTVEKTQLVQIRLEPPTISIARTEFCNDKADEFPIVVSPIGGVVTGEGVKKTDADNYVFVASEVKVGRSISKSVKLTYTIDDVSVSTTVKVYHEPDAEFVITKTPTVGSGRVQVDGSASTFVENYSWDFGDKTDPVTGSKATHDYLVSGAFTITLTVKNGACSAEKKETITVQLEQAPARSCLPLSGLLERFKALRQIDVEQFAAFTKDFAQYSAVATVFEDLTSNPNLSSDEELAIYTARKVAAAFRVWLGALQEIIISDRPTRVLALALYRILADLALRIACIHDLDINKAKVRTDIVFSIMPAQISGWRQVFTQFTDTAKQIIKNLSSDVSVEAERLSGSDESKPAYKAALQKVVDEFSSFQF